MDSTQTVTKKELVRVFLYLGCFGFGGPAAHIAMMRNEVVVKRGWMTEDRFVDLIGITNLLPGPNSTEMAMHVGLEKGGWKGLLIAGFCFITPAVLITSIVAYTYALYGALPQLQPVIGGIRAALVAVVLVLMVHLLRTQIKDRTSVLWACLAALGVVAGLPEIVVLFGTAIVATVSRSLITLRVREAITPIVAGGLMMMSPSAVFLTFLKVGSILYGSGYVLFAFLDEELVGKGFITRQILTDAIAVGQFTPGPVFSSATFIGWMMGGPYTACLATIGIFLPSFLLVGCIAPLIDRLRSSPILASALAAVNIASVILVLFVAVDLARMSIISVSTIVIFLIAVFVCIRFRKINSAVLVIGGGVVGWLANLILGL